MNTSHVNPQAEERVTAAVLLNPDLTLELSDLISARTFGERRYALVYRAVECLLEQGKHPDIVTLADFLDRHKQLEAVGGRAFLDTLKANPEDLQLARQHAEIIREKSLLRGIVATASKMISSVTDESAEPARVLEEAERALLGLSTRRTGGGYELAHDVVANTLKGIEEQLSNPGVLPGISTGFPELDAMTGGLRPGNLYIMAGRPSMGKTALMLNFAAHAVLREGKRVVIHSLEMPSTSLMQRILSSEANVDMQAVTTGRVTTAAQERLRKAAARLSDAHLLIDDDGHLTLGTLRAQARREKQKVGLDAIFIDYLQLMSSGQREESRVGEISRISRELKQLARELDVPVVVLSQLNRGVEGRPNKRPMLSDLRESGSIEQDADLAMFVYRDEYYFPDSDDKGLGELILGKQRNGPVGTVKARWVDALATYRPLEEETVPL